MRALIVSGGAADADLLREYAHTGSFDRIIAADAGLEACHTAGLLPTALLVLVTAASDSRARVMLSPGRWPPGSEKRTSAALRS